MAARIAMVKQLRAAQRAARPKSKKQKPETSIQGAILTALEAVPGVKVERNNRGAKGNGRVRFGLGEGAADLVGSVHITLLTQLNLPDDGEPFQSYADVGRFFALEIKVPGEKPDPHQEQWAEEHRALGGYVSCATSVEEALKCVEEARDVSKSGRTG